MPLFLRRQNISKTMNYAQIASQAQPFRPAEQLQHWHRHAENEDAIFLGAIA